MHAYGSVRTVPHLVGIALTPVVSGFYQVVYLDRVCYDILILWDMRVCRFLPPFPAQYLLALPFALVKDEKTEFREVFSRKIEAPSSGIMSLRGLEPMEFLYS